MAKKICYKCKNAINEKEEYCSLASFYNKEKVHEDSWHRKCWQEHWEELMDKKVKAYANTILKNAQPMIAKLQGVDTIYA